MISVIIDLEIQHICLVLCYKTTTDKSKSYYSILERENSSPYSEEKTLNKNGNISERFNVTLQQNILLCRENTRQRREIVTKIKGQL